MKVFEKLLVVKDMIRQQAVYQIILTLKKNIK